MMPAKMEGRPNIPRDGRHCDLCGCSQPAVRCDKCGCQIFCLSCDDMYHRHPKRRFHLRKAVDPTPPTHQARPVLPMKVAHLPMNPGDPSKMPLPPPRKKKPGKSFFDTFRRRSPTSDNSPPLPKKEYSWTDRLGNIKKFMSNRPLPPVPNSNGAVQNDEDNEEQQNVQSTKHDLSFIHKRVDDKPPQLPQRSLKPNEFTRGYQDKENQPGTIPVQNNREMRNGTLDPSQMSRNGGFPAGEEHRWNDRTTEKHQRNTLQRQPPPPGYMYPGGPGYPGHLSNNMHQSASVTDLQNLNTMDGQGVPPSHYPHYPMNPHMPPHYPYPMYHPQFPNYPQYFGNSFANLASQPMTTDGDFSDHSEASSRHHSGRKYPFRKRAKRSQSVLVDTMGYPGQFYPFGPFPPGYGPGPWGPPFPKETPPSPASSIRSLNRIGRSRRRKKMTSDDEDEEFSVSSSPLSRPKSSSSDRQQPGARIAPPATQSSSSDEEDDAQVEKGRSRSCSGSRSRNERMSRRDSDSKKMPSPLPKSPQVSHKKLPKQKKRDTIRNSEVEDMQQHPDKNDRRSSKDSNTDQNDQDQASSSWVPSSKWQCTHCTFINQAGNRICLVCCKTATVEGTTLPTSRPNSASVSSRKQSLSSENSCSSPEKKMEEEEDVSTKRDRQDMAVLNSALDEAEKEISRGLEELMKLKEDFSPSKPEKSEPSQAVAKKPPTNTEPNAASKKPVYKSTGKMRTSILDKLTMPSNKPSTTSTASASTETQTGTNSNNSTSNTDRIIEARRASTSSTTSDAYNSPTAQSPQLERMDMTSNKPNGVINKSSHRTDSSCQTQTDDLLNYLERRKVEEEAYFGRPNNGYPFRYGDRMDTVTSPVPSMYDRGYGLMQRSHSRASLFTGRLNDLGPLDYGLGPTPMYRSVSRSSLTGDYTENRFSDFHNLGRKPDYYLSMEELVERRRQDSIRAQGLELVRMIREAEQQGFTADDIQVALHNCDKQSPMDWLQENWRHMVEQVINLSTSYANDKKENDVGTVSENESRDALRLHKGNIWAAVTECVESRQRKFLELKARGKFGSKDITDALTASQGDVEMAYEKLTKSSSKPFLMRIWGAGEGVQNQDGAIPRMNENINHMPDRYTKDIADDVQSDELWDEDEEDVDWDEDFDEEDEEEEQGDLDDLQTCHDDVCTSSEIKTPDSDRSDYCDAFGANTLERNMSSPYSDTVCVVNENKQDKKETSFLSKLAALRKDDRGRQSQAKFYVEPPQTSETAPDSNEDYPQESGHSSDYSKTYNPISVIKNTISAIRDSVNGTSKGDKKPPCAAPDRRTIIVKGQIAVDSPTCNEDSDGVKLTSMKPLVDDISINENNMNKNTGAVPKYSKTRVESGSNEHFEAVNVSEAEHRKAKFYDDSSETQNNDGASYPSERVMTSSDVDKRLTSHSELNSITDQSVSSVSDQSQQFPPTSVKSEMTPSRILKNSELSKENSPKITDERSFQRIEKDGFQSKSKSRSNQNDTKVSDSKVNDHTLEEWEEQKYTPETSPASASLANVKSVSPAKLIRDTNTKNRKDVNYTEKDVIDGKKISPNKRSSAEIRYQRVDVSEDRNKQDGHVTSEYMTKNEISNNLNVETVPSNSTIPTSANQLYVDSHIEEISKNELKEPLTNELNNVSTPNNFPLNMPTPDTLITTSQNSTKAYDDKSLHSDESDKVLSSTRDDSESKTDNDKTMDVANHIDNSSNIRDIVKTTGDNMKMTFENTLGLKSNTTSNESKSQKDIISQTSVPDAKQSEKQLLNSEVTVLMENIRSSDNQKYNFSEIPSVTNVTTISEKDLILPDSSNKNPPNVLPANMSQLNYSENSVASPNLKNTEVSEFSIKIQNTIKPSASELQGDIASVEFQNSDSIFDNKEDLKEYNSAITPTKSNDTLNQTKDSITDITSSKNTKYFPDEDGMIDQTPSPKQDAQPSDTCPRTIAVTSTSKSLTSLTTAVAEPNLKSVGGTGNVSEVNSNHKTDGEKSEATPFKSMEPIHSSAFDKSYVRKQTTKTGKTLKTQVTESSKASGIDKINSSPEIVKSSDQNIEGRTDSTMETYPSGHDADNPALVVEMSMYPIVEEKSSLTDQPFSSSLIETKGSEKVNKLLLNTNLAPSPDASADPSLEASAVPLVEAGPAPLIEASPAPLVEAGPAPLVVASPAPLVEASPAPLVEASPVPLVETGLVPFVETSSDPLEEASLAPLAEANLAPLAEASPAPLAEANLIPLSEANSLPLLEASSAPLAESTSAPLAESSSAPLAESSLAPLAEASLAQLAEASLAPVADAIPVPSVETGSVSLIETSPVSLAEARPVPLVETTLVPLAEASPDQFVEGNLPLTEDKSISPTVKTSPTQAISLSKETVNLNSRPSSQPNSSETNLRSSGKPPPEIDSHEINRAETNSEKPTASPVHSQTPSSKVAQSSPATASETVVPVLDRQTSVDNDNTESSEDGGGNSVTPPSPVDALRHRFEGLMDGNSGSVVGPIRPQSPFNRRMSFRSRKEAIILERTRDSSTEKPWFLQKPTIEPKKPLPKRSLKQQMEIERRVRKMVSDRKCRTYRKAEIVVQLMDMNFEEDEALQAANECSTLEQAISYLQQECLLCTGHFPVSHIISMVHCPHKACMECIRAYFTVQIRDRNIMELLCPFCNEPDIFDEDIAQDYFNHLDIMLKKLVDPEIHELFQRKLRDRVLMRDPNFRWCSQCSSGFIAMENLKRLVCPDCNAVTCASCRRPWEREHQGISCEAFAAWKDAADPEAQTTGLAKLLTEDGIDCPRCHFRYALAKGGCMHFRCIQCQHDFCSGCSKPFKMGQKCGVSEFCEKLGLHAHHPRNCLFYLRDKDPEDLQRLLDLSDVKYDRDPPDEAEEKNSCKVMEQKETSDGMLDDYCGKEVEDGFAGLCRIHYVEYLGQLVNKHKVDPIHIFENDDLELVLRRANIRLPPKRYRETDAQYREKLVNLIQDELPLDRIEGS